MNKEDSIRLAKKELSQKLKKFDRKVKNEELEKKRFDIKKRILLIDTYY